MAKLYHGDGGLTVGYVDGYHRRSCEDEFVRDLRRRGADRHVILTVRPGAEIKSVEMTVEVANDIANDVCEAYVIGAGDQKPFGQPHVHVFCNRKDARRLKDAWHKAGLGHVEIVVAKDDPADFRKQAVYVFHKLGNDFGGRAGIICVNAKEAA